MTAVICLNCEAMGSQGCHLCRSERKAAAGGEQGLSPLEIEVEGLRTEVARSHQKYRQEQLRLTLQRDAAERLVCEQRELLIQLRDERDRLLAELALLRVPGGKA